MCQGSLELHVLSHVVVGPLSDVTHLTVFKNRVIGHTRVSAKKQIKISLLRRRKFLGPAAPGYRGRDVVLGPSFFRVVNRVAGDF